MLCNRRGCCALLPDGYYAQSLGIMLCSRRGCYALLPDGVLLEVAVAANATVGELAAYVGWQRLARKALRIDAGAGHL